MEKWRDLNYLTLASGVSQIVAYDRPRMKITCRLLRHSSVNGDCGAVTSRLLDSE